jgi:hypothetical protein
MRGRVESSIWMRGGRLLALLVAVFALGACGNDDDDQTQDAADLSEAWDDRLTTDQQQHACAAFRSVGAQAAGRQISTITDGEVDADAAAEVLAEKC